MFSPIILLEAFKPPVCLVGGQSHESQMKNWNHMNGVCVISEILHLTETTVLRVCPVSNSFFSYVYYISHILTTQK